MRLFSWFALLGSAAAWTTVEPHTQIVMAQEQACVLLAQFEVNFVTMDTTNVVKVRPMYTWPLCGHLNSRRPGLRKIPTTGDFFVVYGGLLPESPDMPFESFESCLFGPQTVDSDNGYAVVPLDKQAIRLDGTTYFYTSDSMYNMTPSALRSAPSFPRLNLTCHSKNDKRHKDSALFGDPSILRMLPNPYKADVQAKGVEGWVDASWTHQTVSFTPPAKRTEIPAPLGSSVVD